MKSVSFLLPSSTLMTAETKEKLINLLQSDLIRFITVHALSNQIGAALKNVIGIAAGILDSLVVRFERGFDGPCSDRSRTFIKYFGGNPHAYGLARLGDYEATLFSKFSHNQTFGEKFARGEDFGKLAERCSDIEGGLKLYRQKKALICRFVRLMSCL